MTGPPDIGPATSGLRLQLKPAARATEFVNGGWWPRSTALPAELPELLTSLSAQLGPIALVGYHLNAWDKAPEHVQFEDRPVLLQGFTDADPHSVIVIGESGQRLTLLVVPPDSTGAIAQRALTGAARPDATQAASTSPEADQSASHVAERIVELEGINDSGREATVAAWVDEAAAQFLDAPVQSFVPILIEHIVRSRIKAQNLVPE